MFFFISEFFLLVGNSVCGCVFYINGYGFIEGEERKKYII